MRSYLPSLLSNLPVKYGEIRYEKRVGTFIQWIGKELEEIQESEEEGGGIRILEKGWGFTSFNDPSRIEKSLLEALKIAKVLPPRRIKLFPVPKLKKKLVTPYKKDPRKIELEEKYRFTQKLNQLLLSHPKIQTTNVKYVDSFRVKYLCTTEGSFLEEERIEVVVGITAITREGNNLQIASEGLGGVEGYELIEKAEEKAEEVAKRAIELLKAEPPPKGKYTVILDQKLCGVFAHEAFGHLSEADFLYENLRLKKIMKLGRVFGPPSLNLVDNPLIEGEGGYYLWDDEGVIAQKTYLIKEGKLVGRLHSRETASKMEERPTGNARALSYEYPPLVRMSNTYIEPQDTPFEEMLSEIERGIYARGFRGGQTNLELFTFAPEEGWLIEKGRLTRRLRDFNLTGNVFLTLKNIEKIGNDLVLYTGPGGCGKGGQSPLPVSTGGPHLLIREVVVGGR